MSKQSVLNIQHWHTTQSVPVYFVHTPELPMIDIRLVFQAGASRSRNAPGLANLTSALLDEGTRQLSADDIAQRFDKVGAIYRGGLSYDSVSVSLRSLTHDNFLSPALETFAHILNDPVFPLEAFERIKKQALTSLEEDLQYPSYVAKNTFYEALYPNHAYGQPISGHIDSVKQLTRDDVERFHALYYTAQNAVIAIVGNATLAKAQEISEKLAEQLLQGKKAQPLEFADEAPAATHTVHFPSQQTTIFLGQVGISVKDADYFPLIVGNYTLGGGGMVSRLFHQVREQKGLAYSVQSSFMPLLARGPFLVKLQTRNQEAKNAIELVNSILHDFIQQGPTEQELHAAKKNLMGGFALELASNANIIGELTRIGFYEFPLDYLDTYRDNIAAVTTERICAAFQKYIQPNKLVQIAVGG